MDKPCETCGITKKEADESSPFCQYGGTHSFDLKPYHQDPVNAEYVETGDPIDLNTPPRPEEIVVGPVHHQEICVGDFIRHGGKTYQVMQRSEPVNDYYENPVLSFQLREVT